MTQSNTQENQSNTQENQSNKCVTQFNDEVLAEILREVEETQKPKSLIAKERGLNPKSLYQALHKHEKTLRNGGKTSTVRVAGKPGPKAKSKTVQVFGNLRGSVPRFNDDTQRPNVDTDTDTSNAAHTAIRHSITELQSLICDIDQASSNSMSSSVLFGLGAASMIVQGKINVLQTRLDTRNS